MQNKKIVPIKYTSRDFYTIKRDLVEYAKRYYPDTFKDFNEASFGSLVLDTVAYVGDVLSFQTDYSANESHLKTSIEFNNILKHANKMGYKYNPYQSSYGIASIYCVVPAITNGLGPDLTYAPIVKKGTSFASGDKTFTLREDINMANADFTVRVAKVNENGTPTHFAIKGAGSVVSGVFKRQIVSVDGFKKFRRIKLDDLSIADVISVIDEEGNEYFEAEYLSQNISYKEIPNISSDKASAPNVLVPFAIPRRFVVDREETDTYIMFGASDSAEVENNNMLQDPTKFVMEMYGRQYITDISFDPKKLINSDKFGISPSNTNLYITYRVNSDDNMNISAGSLDTVTGLSAVFVGEKSLVSSLVREVRNSFAVENDEPITGFVNIPDADELKLRIANNFAAQSRAVTEKDYEAMCYSMPPKYGCIKRARLIKDQSSYKKNLNLYLLSEDVDGKLTSASLTIKKNLKTWLDKSRSLSDTIDIIDAKIINIGISYVVKGVVGVSKSDVMDEANRAIVNLFARTPEIGEPLAVNDILTVLKNTTTVLDVKEISIYTKRGGNYSNIGYEMSTNTASSLYDNVLEVPLNVIWEVKYPSSDIRGTIL